MNDPVIVVSNRGPVAFSVGDDGEVVPRRGAGGLASSLAPLVERSGAAWIAAALSDADRIAAAQGPVDADGFHLRLLSLDAEDYRMAYDVISNGTLWFIHHGIYDLARRPRLDRRWRLAWDAYRRVNRAFAESIVEWAPPQAVVLVQDYHLALVGTWLSQERPDLRTVHFTHTPFCGPDSIRILPAAVAEELLSGMASHLACGFHTRRWADAFEACCNEVIGYRPTTFVSSLAPDRDDIETVGSSPECLEQGEQLAAMLGDRRMILRVDRMELSKNYLRGFLAFEELLEAHPRWRRNVTFAALTYPSREGLPEYLAYRQEVEALARRINQTWGTPDWMPIVLDTTDDFPRSVAALQRYDVLLVNSVRDGLNLVAKEGALLNRRDGVLALSREAGAWEELQDAALEVNPFDITGTAEVLAAALELDPRERTRRASLLRRKAEARTPADWLEDQLRAAARGTRDS